MLYPELPFEPAAFPAVPPRRREVVTAAGRRLAPGHPSPAWYEPDSAYLTAVAELAGAWTLASRHPTDERICVSVGEPPNDALYEIELWPQRVSRLPFPAGASAQYVGATGLVVLVDDQLTLFEHRFGEAPTPVHAITGTYPGRLVAAVDDVVVLAGLEAPWVFFKCDGTLLWPVGQIGVDALTISDCFVKGGELRLVGRGAGEDDGIFAPVLEPADSPWPASAGELAYDDAWHDARGLPADGASWPGTRDFQEVLAEPLAAAGICLLAPPGAAAPPSTLVLWFRDRLRNVSVLAVPDDRIDARARAALDARADQPATSADHVLGAVEPLWAFVAGVSSERGGGGPVRVAGKISRLVRLRSP